jgi:hypothetical protein
MPPTQTNVVQKLRYPTDPLPKDELVAGPSVLHLCVEIDQDDVEIGHEDTNWIVTLRDAGPDVSAIQRNDRLKGRSDGRSHGIPSFALSSSFTAFGFALPADAFIT